jgi:3-dehydroquinate dehydratase type I
MEADALFLKEIRSAARAAGCRLILSHHDFRRTPPLEKLRAIVARGLSLGADLVKVACLVNSGRAAARLLSILAEPRFQKRVLVTGMGKKGRIVRIAAPLLGSPFTYAAPVRGRGTAPGQLALAEMERVFRILGKGA